MWGTRKRCGELMMGLGALHKAGQESVAIGKQILDWVTG